MTILKTIFSYRGMMSLILISGLAFGLCLGFAVAAPAPLVLKGQTSDADSDGKVTLGEVFDYTGASSDVVIAERKAATVVLDAVRVQLLAQSLGLYWDNPNGLRRIIVTNGGAAPQAQTAPAAFATNNAPVQQSAQPQAQAPSPVMIKRGDIVSVLYRSQNLSLRASGLAQRDARLGERTTLINPASKKPIEDVIVTGPGTAESGPLAQAPAPSFASR